jgi:8-oxo-dGTP pyrophosphatase MutT (NUDIX family)
MARPDSAFVVLRRHGQVLLVHSRSDRRWQLPGGRIEWRETPWAAARRECGEETGLTPRLVRLTGVYHRRDGTQAYVFAGRLVGSRSVCGPTGEIKAQRWVTLSDAQRLLARRHWRRLQDALRPARFEPRRLARARG